MGLPTLTLMQADTAPIAFLLTLFVIPVFGVATVLVIRLMILKEMEVPTGLISLAAILNAFVTIIWVPSPLIKGVILVSFIALMVLYPFALDQLARSDLREFNADRIDQFHAVLHQNPRNAPAAFGLAQALYQHGLRGHAIALADQVAQTLSSQADPVSMRSTADLYRSEIAMLRRWQNESQAPQWWKPFKSRLCNASIPPGPWVCPQCQAAYFRDHVMAMEGTNKVMLRLVVTWALLSVLIPGAAFLGTVGGVIPALALFAICGALVYWLFAPRGVTVDR